MNRTEQQIQSLIDSFVQELSGLVRQAALESVSQALNGPNGGGARRSSARRGANGSGRSTEPRRAAGRRPGPRGPKRTPEALLKLQAALLEEIQLNPGQRMEQIGQTLGVETKDLDLLIKKLIGAKKIKKKGRTRATTYFAV